MNDISQETQEKPKSIKFLSTNLTLEPSFHKCADESCDRDDSKTIVCELGINIGTVEGLELIEWFHELVLDPRLFGYMIEITPIDRATLLQSRVTKHIREE